MEKKEKLLEAQEEIFSAISKRNEKRLKEQEKVFSAISVASLGLSDEILKILEQKNIHNLNELLINEKAFIIDILNSPETVEKEYREKVYGKVKELGYCFYDGNIVKKEYVNEPGTLIKRLRSEYHPINSTDNEREDTAEETQDTHHS